MNFLRVSSRGLATKAKARVPLTLHGIDGRYATALFTAASKSSSVEKVESELKVIESAIKRDPALKTFLETPLVDRTAKKQGVASLLSKGKYSTITKNFFDVLAENGRLDQTGKILAAYSQLMTASRGEVSVTVTSAKELDGKSLNKLRDILSGSSLVESGSSLIFSNKVDPQIIGGLVVEVGDKTIDLSVSSKITKLNGLIAQAV